MFDRFDPARFQYPVKFQYVPGLTPNQRRALRRKRRRYRLNKLKRAMRRQNRTQI